MKKWNVVHTAKMQCWFDDLVKRFGQTNDVCERGKILIEVDVVLKRWWLRFIECVGVPQEEAQFLIAAELERRQDEGHRTSRSHLVPRKPIVHPFKVSCS